MDQAPLELIAVAVGNTRTRLGLFREGELTRSLAVANAPRPSTDVADLARSLAELGEDLHEPTIVLSSVNPPISRALRERLELDHPGSVYAFGQDIPIPIAHALDDDSTVGQDRLLSALGAFAREEQACVVVDAGTAVTVDFVDGQGVFQGGVIAPGAGMMLRALHEGTASLPPLGFEPPDPSRGPFGKDTPHAMQLGTRDAIVGLVRLCVERFAEAFGAYPMVLATGGDAPRLFEGDALIDRIVPDLQLLGIARAVELALDEDPEP